MRSKIFFICIILIFTGCKEEPQPIEVEPTVTLPEIEAKDSLEISDSEEDEQPSVTYAQQKSDLLNKGYQVFDYVDAKTGDSILMQQYFIAFLKKGPVRNQNEEEAAKLQEDHLAHLSKMYELGYADISGPMGDNGNIRGITIYNVPTLAMADSLANSDPMVKAKRLVIEIHPWWAAKGTPLR